MNRLLESFIALGVALGLGAYLVMVQVLPVHAQAPERTPGWAIAHAPAANTAATITRAAVTNQRHIADCVNITFAAGASAPTAIPLTVTLRDGATGAGTVLLAWAVSISAVAGQAMAPIAVCGLNTWGGYGTAMTLEFSAAGGANTIEAVALRGHDQ